MNNVLLVGNGFDLAHGLLTKYEHFLYIMKNWDDFYSAFKNERNKDTNQEKNKKSELEYLMEFNDFWAEFSDPIYKYLRAASKMDEKRIEQLGNIISNNSWIGYYCNCEAEIDGWIDFEKEIYPVIELFEFIFDYNYELEYNRDGSYNLAIPLSDCSAKIIRTAELWDKYFDYGRIKLYLKGAYMTNNHGILKKKILKELRSEYDDFILAFEIYLSEFVNKVDNIELLKQIEEINVTSVISFNYTLTEMLYGLNEEDVHHIHGMLRNNLLVEKNNMVMGVNKQNDTNLDFIYFAKYFQRIQKKSGVKYKELVKKKTTDNNVTHTDYVLHIYGHSLDETDEDILKYIMGDVDGSGKMKLKPKKVIIYFYDAIDYEQKVINLIKLYGRTVVEEYMENGLFGFAEIRK